MAISAQQKKFLRAQAHHLNVTLTVGNKGLTPALVNEAMVALGAHELIKVRLPQGDKQTKLQTLQALCTQTTADLVQLIGRTGVMYAPASPPNLTLPTK